MPRTDPPHIAAAEAGPIVDARDVHKTYETGPVSVAALRGVSLQVRRGEMSAVMGPSGCGKTTLLNCLSGLDDVNEGTIRIEGHDLSLMGDDDRTTYRARRMGFVFQSFNLLPVLSAIENVELPLLVSGTGTREARTRATAALAEVGLDARIHHKPKELSGGEQQRVAIARSIVNDPAIVWADEPTGNLDTDTSASIVALLRDLNERHGLTFVIVTHAAEVAAQCHRMIRMRNGRIETVTAQAPRPAEPRRRG